MRKPFMVEFTGTPEAGKTTSINNVANKLTGRGYKVSVLQEKQLKDCRQTFLKELGMQIYGCIIKLYLESYRQVTFKLT